MKLTTIGQLSTLSAALGFAPFRKTKKFSSLPFKRIHMMSDDHKHDPMEASISYDARAKLGFGVTRASGDGTVVADAFSKMNQSVNGTTKHILKPKRSLSNLAPPDDQKIWERAAPPNYFTNANLGLGCSECVYGCSNSTKLSFANIKSDILDFWGEGRTTGDGVSTGFTNCYNVNYQFQVVSPAADDAGRKIPNRIPTQTHANSDIGMYVDCNTFLFVTLMSAPINEMTAQEMTRVVEKENGMIILYGSLDEDSIRCFENQAAFCDFFYDKFTSALVTSIEGLENIVVYGHPRCTRVYHKACTRIVTMTNCTTWLVREESGNEKGGYSSFVAPEGHVFVGQKQEEGKTWYETGTILLNNGIVSSICSTSQDSSGWVSVGRESGEGTNRGSLQFISPEGSVLMGRRHCRNNDGDIYYRYGWITCSGIPCETYDVSDWISTGKGSRTNFTCPDGTVIVGCLHTGDGYDETWFKVARVRVVIESH